MGHFRRFWKLAGMTSQDWEKELRCCKLGKLRWLRGLTDFSLKMMVWSRFLGRKLGRFKGVLWSWDGTHPTSKTSTKNEIWNLGKIYICLEEQGGHPPRFFIYFQIVSSIFGLFRFHFCNKWNIHFLLENRSLNVKKCLIFAYCV